MDVNQYLSTLFASPDMAAMPAGVAGVDAYGRHVAGGAGRAADFTSSQAAALGSAYLNDYMPYDRKFMGYVDTLGSEAYRGQERARAMNDVTLQAEAARQQMERQGAAAGVNYGDPRFAFLRGQLAAQTALGKVMAAAGSDRNARDEWAKGLGAINAMGLRVGELGLRNMDAANNLAKTGLMGMDMGAAAADRNTQAAASMTSAGASAANAATNARNTDLNYQLGLGRLALERYNIDTGNAFRTRQLDEQARMGSFGNTFLSTLAGAGSNWLINGGIGKIGSGLSNILGGGSKGGYEMDGLTNDFNIPQGSNALDTWATMGTGGD